MPPVKQWSLKKADSALVDAIAARLNVTRAAATVLVNRGVTTPEQAKGFLSPSLRDAFNPFLLPDIDRAVRRIRQAVDGKEKILVYGDRDVDGIASISVMIRTLKSLGAAVLWYIPSDEGYGLHNDVIERYAGEGVNLIITVDCGVSAVEQVRFARSLGIETVVTDHHEPPAGPLPDAVAVVDPKRAGSEYPFSDLAGCAVSFKVAEAVMLSFGKYFDRELLFAGVRAAADGTPPEVGAIKAKNGRITGRFSGTLAGDARDAFARFAAGARPVTYRAGARPDDLQSAGIRLDGEIIDLRSLAEQQVPQAADLSAVALALGCPAAAGQTVQDEALSLFEVFVRLDGLSDLRMRFFRENNLDVVTLGTIADIMPLVKENRLLVKEGLKQLGQSRKVGVRMLLDHCLSRNRNNGTGITAKSISWNIAPLLNSAGRLGKANLSAELLLTESSAHAGRLLEEILRLNSVRKELQSENLEKFIPLLREQCDLENDKIFVVTASGIEHGVTGIIASQIMRQYHRPTVLLIVEGEEAMGAARSVEGFDIVGALGKMSDLLVKYGGHSQAAGLTVRVDRFDEFRRRLKAIAEQEIMPHQLVPVVEIDSELEAGEVTAQLVAELAEMEPYGPGNPHPVFFLRGMKVKEHGTVGNNGNHLKLRVTKNGGPAIAAVGWGLGALDEDIGSYPFVDLAVQIELNVWQDRQNVQLVILDLKPSAL